MPASAAVLAYARPAAARSHARMSQRAPLHIMLAEDDDSDVMLAEVSLDLAEIPYELYTLKSGAEVVPYLSGKLPHIPKSDILMLDLSLPHKDGFEVLAELAAGPESYQEMPIVILTGDTRSAFLRDSFGLNIVAYLTKPCSAEKMRSAIDAARKWL